MGRDVERNRQADRETWSRNSRPWLGSLCWLGSALLCLFLLYFYSAVWLWSLMNDSICNVHFIWQKSFRKLARVGDEMMCARETKEAAQQNCTVSFNNAWGSGGLLHVPVLFFVPLDKSCRCYVILPKTFVCVNLPASPKHHQDTPQGRCLQYITVSAPQ